MNATLQSSLDTANNLAVSPSTLSASSRAKLAAAIASAAQAQKDATSEVLAAHLLAGELAAEAVAEAAIVHTDKRAGVLAAIDEIIDKSWDGIARNARRQEIRRQIALSHLAAIVTIDGLPVGHAKSLVGAFVKFDFERGACDTSHLDECRAVLADYRHAPCNVKAFRAAIAAALGKAPSGKRREKSLLDTLRGILADPDTTDARRASIYHAHPELHPDYVAPEEVTRAVAAIGKLTAASQLAIYRALESLPAVESALLAMIADADESPE